MPLEMERVMYRIFINGLSMTSDNDQLSKENSSIFNFFFFSFKIFDQSIKKCVQAGINEVYYE